MSLSVSVALTSWSAPGFAGGFAIGTQSGSGTGNAFAGGAAAADDASVVWFNPAAMTALPSGKHITGALHFVKPSFKFSNNGSTGALAAPGLGNGGDGGDWAYIPNGFFVMDINPSLRFGVALNAPFGLKTDYDILWRGQLTALKSDIKTININPSIAYKVSNHFSIGAGVSVQSIDAELSSGANLAGTNIFKLKADDIGYGFNIGATFQPSTSTRLGMHYRSSIKYKLEGDASFSLAPALNGPATADLKTPASASLSVFHQASPSVELMADVTWTQWSNLQQLAVVRGTPLPAIPTLQFQWDDTWRFGVGANYRLNSQTKLRFGLALDKTPTNDQHRTPRLPDQDRTWIAFGVQYKPSKQGTVEFGYAHEFLRDASVNVATPAGNLVGTFKNRADIISLQYSHSF
ncbi:MAG TPA: outer membrane protein transport protein [Burkholderiales bacterium]|nr:outer membrane protein transport protein [Burkholderiales bacterium]